MDGTPTRDPLEDSYDHAAMSAAPSAAKPDSLDYLETSDIQVAIVKIQQKISIEQLLI